MALLSVECCLEPLVRVQCTPPVFIETTVASDVEDLVVHHPSISSKSGPGVAFFEHVTGGRYFGSWQCEFVVWSVHRILDTTRNLCV